MYTIEQYIKDTLSLTNSIIIKFKDNALFINKRIEAYYNIVIDDDPSTWRYYLNLNGEKHFTNTDVMLYLLEDNTKVSLTKDVLDKYPLTKEELLKQGTYYNNLLLEYPNDIDYIKGCMYPIDLDTAVNAEDGTILAINRTYVEDQELNIIKLLENKIKDFISRWHISAYLITDELYISSFIGTLYSAIPSMIMNLRLERIKTNQAHSFHIEHYFRSNLNLWDDIKILNKESIIWLYKNLEYIISNVGSNKTLDIIAKKIFEVNKIGLGNYYVLPLDKAISDDGEKYTKEPIVVATPLNNYYNDDIEFKIDVEQTVIKELQNDTEITRDINDLEKQNIVNTETTIVNKAVNNKQTKIIDVNTIKPFDLYGNDVITNLLDYWLYFSSTGVYTIKIPYTDPNTNEVYKLTPKQGLLFLFYQISVIMGTEDKRINNIETRSLIDTEIGYDELTKDMYDPETSKDSIVKILDKRPTSISLLKTPTEFKTYFDKLVDMYITGRVEDSNIDNPIVCNDIKYMFRKLRKYNTWEFDNKTFKEMLEDDGITIVTSDTYDHMMTILTLTDTFTKVNIDNSLELIAMLKAYMNILLKLTSYDTQIISDDIEDGSIKAPYSTASIINTTQGLVNVNTAHTDALEQEYTKIKAHGNDFKEHFKIGYIGSNNYGKINIENIGIMSIFDYDDFNVKPRFDTYASLDGYYGMLSPELASRGDSRLDNLLLSTYATNTAYSALDIYNIGIVINKYKDLDTNTLNGYAEIIDGYMTDYYPELKSLGITGEHIIEQINTLNGNTSTSHVSDLGVISYSNEPTTVEVLNTVTTTTTAVTLD